MAKNKYKLRYSETFRKDVKGVLFYIVNELQNPIVAENLLQLIENEINKRIENPESFKFFSLAKSNVKWYRINVNNYVIFYTVEENYITLRRFIYSKRNLDKLI